MSDSLYNRAVRAIASVEPEEQKATLVSTGIIFVLMTSYYIMRPVRDSLASDWSDSEVSMLWNINFFVSALIVAAYGYVVSRSRLRRVLPTLYGFFAFSFLAFFLIINTLADRDLTDKMFYLWVSVFALFHVSAFWTLMADTFRPEQATRLFGIFMAGSSAGVLAGPAIAASLAGVVETDRLLLLASLGLVAVIPATIYLYRLKASELSNEQHAADVDDLIVGGRFYDGFVAFVRNPYLLAIGLFILLYVFIGSFVYFEQKNLLAEFSRDDRVRILAGIDLVANLLTFGLALFVTGRLVRRLGMPVALALVPVVIAAGMLILAFAPVLVVLIAVQIARRGGNYGLTRPAREMLFTKVSRDDRFKSKPVVDIVVYRGGDAVSGTLYAALSDGLGLGLAALAGVGAAIAAAWAAAGVWLGGVFDRRASVNRP